MKKNALKKAIAVLAAAALLCSSAAAYAAQVSGPSGIETAAVQSAQNPVTIYLRGHRLSSDFLYMNIGIDKNASDIAKMQYRVSIEKQSHGPNTDPSGWWTYIGGTYYTLDTDTIMWAESIQYDSAVESIRTVVDVRVTYNSGAVETVTRVIEF